MGILDVHLHEPEFNFAPRMGTESTDEAESEGEAEREERERVSPGATESGESNGGGAGALVALAVLVVAAIAVRRFRKGRGDEAFDEEMAEELAELGE